MMEAFIKAISIKIKSTEQVYTLGKDLKLTKVNGLIIA